MLFETLVIGSFLYTGNVLRKKIALYRTRKDEITPSEPETVPKEEESFSQHSSTPSREHEIIVSEQVVNRKLTVSGLSMVLSVAGSLFYPPLLLLSILGIAYSSTDIFKSAYYSLVQEKKMNVDSTIAILVVVCINDGLLFFCGLNTFLATLSRKLLLGIKDNSQNDIIDVFKQQPHTAWVLIDGIEVERPVETFKPGDTVIVNAGETVPVDGYICFGTASLDQHILTGESLPAEKGLGEKVFALTLVLSGRIGIQVENAGQQTTAAQIGRILNQTTNLKTDMQLWVEEAGDKAVVPIVLLSGVCLPLLGSSGAMAILNSHPKYKTTIATYIGVLNFLSIASRKGILIKDGRVFELLSKVDTVVFDKTGTLTENKMLVRQIYADEGYEKNEILTLAALAEQRQTHPIAKAILQEVTTRQLDIPEAVETSYKIGYGLSVKKNDATIRVGSVRFMETEGFTIPQRIKEIQEFCRQQGNSLVLIAVNDKVVGGIELQAVVRPEAEAIISGLRQRNINSVYIISGDHEIPTKRLSASLNADRYFAEILPEDKANLIEKFQKEGRTVCFVGDGINDSIALKKADISVSLRGASTIATDSAQIILMDESLNQFCCLFDMAKEYDSNTKMTFTTVLMPHLMGLGGALFLHFGLLQSVILNQIGLTLGAGNALLPRMRHQQKDSE